MMVSLHPLSIDIYVRQNPNRKDEHSAPALSPPVHTVLRAMMIRSARQDGFADASTFCSLVLMPRAPATRPHRGHVRQTQSAL